MQKIQTTTQLFGEGLHWISISHPKQKNFQMDKQALQTETINSRGKYKNACKA